MLWNQFLLQDTPKAPFSGREFFDLRSQSRTLQEIAVVAPQFISLGEGGEPVEILAARATAGIFPVLGVEAAVGRVFTPEEDVFGNNDVVLLGHEIWRDRFGADPAIAGRKVTLDGKPYLVTGVLPAGFSFGTSGFDVWIPQGLSADRLMPRHVRTVTLAARLAPGVSLAAAQAEMDVLAERFRREEPEAYPADSGYGIRVVPVREDLVGDVRTPLLVLFGAVGLVLLISCVNVANLLLARAATRSREVAIRTALGSSRGALVRQFLSEGLLLSLLGAALGLLLAFAATRLLAAHPGTIPRLDQVRLDGSVLLFTLALVAATGVVFGLVPVFHSTRRNLRDPLQEGGRTPAGAGSAGQRARTLLVVAEIGLAVTVLVGAGLMIRSFGRLLDVDPGFRTEGLLTARFSLTRTRYPEDAQVVTFQRRLLQQAAALPGVERAAVASELPMGIGMGLGGEVTLEGRAFGPGEPPPVTGWRMVSPGYFEALGIALRQGRTFAAADDERSPAVVVVEEDLARRFWPGENPLGKRLKLNARTPEQSVWRTVVGVVGHVRQQGLSEAGGDQLYVPLPQHPVRLLTLVLDPAGSPASLAAEARRAVWALDRGLPVEVRTIEQVIAGSLGRRRFHTSLFTAFGAVSLLLTVIGVYGVMAYSVAQRTRDMGIRMALGARRGDVLRHVVGQGAALTLTGLALGLAAAWSLSRLMSTLVFGVAPRDAATFAAVALLLAGVGLAASYLPARRASRVDPAVALHGE